MSSSGETSRPRAASGPGNIDPEPVIALDWHDMSVGPWPSMWALAANHDVFVDRRMWPSGDDEFSWRIQRTAESIDAWAGGFVKGLDKPVAEGTAPTLEEGIAEPPWPPKAWASSSPVR